MGSEAYLDRIDSGRHAPAMPSDLSTTSPMTRSVLFWAAIGTLTVSTVVDQMTFAISDYSVVLAAVCVAALAGMGCASWAHRTCSSRSGKTAAILLVVWGLVLIGDVAFRLTRSLLSRS